MSTPDPEETEREALEQAIAKALLSTSPAVDVGAIATFVSLSGFRRLSESEIRREWGVLTQGNDDHETFWCSTEDNARAIMHDGDTLMSRSAAVPAGEWTREEK